MAFVDTNILLRWLLADHPELTPKAEKLIASAHSGELVVTTLVASEVAYVLRGSGRDRAQTASALNLIAATPTLRYEHEGVMAEVIGYFREYGLDFTDCYLVARAHWAKQPLRTSDKKLLRLFDAIA